MNNTRRISLIAVAMALAISTVTASAETVQEALPTIESGKSGAPVVGVYYYPWYHGSREWRNVMRQHLKPPQQPKLGLYRSDSAEVVADHIAQSVRGGISFWAVSWWGPGHETDVNLQKAILAHPDAGKLKYAILYEATGRFGSFDRPSYRRWISDLTYLQEKYFNHPYYLRLDGRPVIFVYLTREYFRNKGDEALKEMREKFPQIYLVGDDVFGAGYRSEWAKKFDAVTAYDVYGQSTGRFGGTRKAVQFLADNYQHARQQANSVDRAFIPTIAPGYNDTAVRKGHPGRARYFSDVDGSQEGDVFRAMINQVALPNLDSRSGRMMMVTSFNEWFEDSQIEATAGTAPTTDVDDSNDGKYYTGGQRYVDYGYLYLDILRDLSGAAAPTGK
jgi:glycoprotein endo-alpha-1,2-mannosidase